MRKPRKLYKVYYNDNDPKCCAWLQELIVDGLIPPGVVDCRSITDIDPASLAGYDQCHFFAGIGGWPLALQWADWPADRQVWTGSCPCQPFSCAGKGRGTDDERHLWPAFQRLIAECRPATVFGEQVASKAGREWLAGVRSDLETLDYAVGAADLCAASVGAPHIRQRLWWVANPETAKRGSVREEHAGRGTAEVGRPDGIAGGLGNGLVQGLEGHGRLGEEPVSEGRQGTERHGSAPSWNGPTVWHPCRDRKVRRIPGRVVNTTSVGQCGGSENCTRKQSGVLGQGLEHCTEPERELENPNVPRVGNTHTETCVQEQESLGARPERLRQENRPACTNWDNSNGPSRVRQHLLEIEPFFQSLVNGLPKILGDSWSDFLNKIETEVRKYATTKKARPHQILRAVWQIIEAQANQEALRGYDRLQEAEILLIALCQLERAVGRVPQGIYDGGDETQGQQVSEMRKEARKSQNTSCSPLGRRLDEQHSGEFSHIVYELSCHAAQLCAAPESTNFFNALCCFPLGGGIPGRVGLLRGAGNAIVPEVAAEFIRAYLETERTV